MVFLDFDGLDGSLAVPSWPHTRPNNDALHEQRAAVEKTAALEFTEPVEGSIEDLSVAHTEPVPNPADYSSTAHTEPVTGVVDDSVTGDQRSAEHVDRTAGTQALQATSARLAANRLRKLGDDAHETHSTIPSLNDQVAPELLVDKDKPPIDQPQHQRRHALASTVVTFLAGMIIGGGILYFWVNGGSWQSESSLYIADSVTPSKPHAETTALPSTNKGMVRRELDSLVYPTPTEDLALSSSTLSDRQGEQSTTTPNNTSIESRNTDFSTQPASSIESDIVSPEVVSTLAQKKEVPNPNALNSTKNLKSVFLEQSEAAVFQDSALSEQSIQPKSWTIPFIFNKLKIDPEIVSDLLPELKQCDGALDIIGHTCTLGDEEKNFFVGLARADFVRDQLVKLGISRRRLRVISVGGDRPVTTNSTKAGREANRRVVIDCRPE